ncbi:MAG: response regulator [Desulfobulbus sp.]|nr:response regulator [Desulfobulbus sp.]
MNKKEREFKVLLVDDEDVFREATARQLSVRGFIVQTAGDGETAIKMVTSDPPEVVVLDQQMPGMHGSDTFVAIKKINPLIEVIMLTGNTSVDNAIELMRMGTFDYLMKPINIDELLYKIEDAYTRKKLNEKQQRETDQQH